MRKHILAAALAVASAAASAQGRVNIICSVQAEWCNMISAVYARTTYTMVATLVQPMGEDKAFEYLKALHKNVSQYTRSGTGPIKAVARGETAVSISFAHDGPGE